MTLAQFILDNLESLLQDWTAFASSTSAGRKLDVAALRDHAEAMLRAIALDMTAEQSRQQQRLKSEGSGPRLSAADTAAELHGSARRASGFGLEQMVTSYGCTEIGMPVQGHWGTPAHVTGRPVEDFFEAGSVAMAARGMGNTS